MARLMVMMGHVRDVILLQTDTVQIVRPGLKAAVRQLMRPATNKRTPLAGYSHFERGMSDSDPRRRHTFAARTRSALVITLTEESAIAAAAMIGDSSRPNTG